MNPDYRIYVVVLFRQFNGASAARDRRSDRYNPRYTSRIGACEHVVEVVCEIGVI
jgi:hypothetical protein